MDTRKAAAWFIIAIMVLSIGGVIGGTLLGPTDPLSITQEFNGYTFIRENNVWTSMINGQKYSFLYLPQEVQSIALPLSVTGWRAVGKVHLIDETVANKSVSLSASSIPLLQAVLYVNGVRLQEACLSENDCAKDIPIVTCQSPGIILRDAALSSIETTLTSDGQCLAIGAVSALEWERITERIIYEFLGVLS
ncbi:hypothetical protein HYT55_02135 [Candidatus Woesearchaeota archaeon]|nr:hypothetical protein [Candidatus Woesearchaeota archaeon]